MITTQILNSEEIQRIHTCSLKILSKVGVRFLSPKAREILKARGAIVKDKIVFIPEELVNEALRTAPKTFILGARDRQKDFTMPKTGLAGTVVDNSGVFTLDFHTGERRECNLQDLFNFNKVYEASRWSTVVWPATIQEPDRPEHSREFRQDIYSFMSTSLHVQSELWHPAEVPLMAEALNLITGSEAETINRKIYSFTYCTNPPLGHDKEMCETYLESLPLGIPICVYPMPGAGSTGPASLFSNIAVANAEALSALVLFQMAKPGTPIIFGNAIGTTNFRNGNFLEGVPETVLQTAACGELAHFYGLPNEQAGCLTDAKTHGAQAILEKTITTIPLLNSGVDLLQGPGALECSNTITLEQIVVDDEIINYAQRLRRGIDTSIEKNYFTDIEEVGPGGHYLMQPSTVMACRSDEFMTQELTDGDTYETWTAKGKHDMYSKARIRVEEILAGAERYPLADNIKGGLEDIMRKADILLSPEKLNH
ncbi:MAG: trimethylamine methyltransferase family protein [Spirochaetales bacterium]|nr:trimethylamine methyltransferase family protein [Spirochaetales bacterium]